MARIGVFSDTHGSTDHLDFFSGRLGQIDSVFHLGDFARDAYIISERFGTGFVSVRGNCDPWSDIPLERVIEWNGHRILLLHGHTKNGKLALSYEALSKQCGCVLFGHSHVASAERYRGILLVNPGSLSLPRCGQKPSCALLTLTPEDASAELIFQT